MKATSTMSMETEMEMLQGDINHLMDIQNRQEPSLDPRRFPMHDHITEEIGHLEKVWGQLYDKVHITFASAWLPSL